jgi:hypothetical protein
MSCLIAWEAPTRWQRALRCWRPIPPRRVPRASPRPSGVADRFGLVEAAQAELRGGGVVLAPRRDQAEAGQRAGRQCFVLIEGRATVEAAGSRLRELGAGSFVGLGTPTGGRCPGRA